MENESFVYASVCVRTWRRERLLFSAWHVPRGTVARSSWLTIRRKIGRRGWRSREGVGVRGTAREYVSAYNLVSHSRAQALGQVAIDGTGSRGKWPVPSPGPPDSLVEDRPLCWDRTSAPQTLTVPAGQPLHPSLSSSLFVPAILSSGDNPTSEKSTCRANVNEGTKLLRSA